MATLRFAVAYLAIMLFAVIVGVTTVEWVAENPQWTAAQAFREMWPYYFGALACAGVALILWERPS